MPIFRIFITALIVLSNASVAMAQIYKCDGPDGPIYSDQKCAPSAATVELSESAGLTGVSDEELSELAEKSQLAIKSATVTLKVPSLITRALSI